MTLTDLITARAAEVAELKKTHEQTLARMRGITTKARDEARDQLTGLEQAEYDQLREEASTAEKRYDAANRSLDELQRAAADEGKNEREASETEETPAARVARGEQAGPEGAPKTRGYDQQHRIAGEKRTYDKESDPDGAKFFRDIISVAIDRTNYDADDRLRRHMKEERVEWGDEKLTRAAGTGAFAGLTVPQYLTDLYAPAVTAQRPFADACNHHQLPASGMTLNISRITTGTSVALQATENSAVSNTDIDDTLLTINVQTAAGQQTLSRQAIERGAGVEEVTLQDLFKRHATVIDSTLLNQATTGLSAIATANAYTSGSPTGTGLYPKLLASAAGSEAALLGQGNADIAVMHSRRWYWMQSQLTSTWPMFQQGNGGAQVMGSVDLQSKYGSGARGVLPSGLVVVTDNNVVTNTGAGTNEDEIYVAPSEECHLWEDPNAPMFIRAEQPAAASLGILLVVYSYFAYTFGRYPAAMQKIGGTGLVTPTF